jgi:CDP-6-deoxy-D-xylo-4-hexulose-3-dehydrase
LNKETTRNRSDVVNHLGSLGIDTRPIVAGNFTKNPVMTHLQFCTLPDLPVADHVHESGFFIGNHHYDVRDDLQVAIEEIDRALESD